MPKGPKWLKASKHPGPGRPFRPSECRALLWTRCLEKEFRVEGLGGSRVVFLGFRFKVVSYF